MIAVLDNIRSSARLGAASATATNVSVNNDAAYRRGEYYWKELSVNNASAARVANATGGQTRKAN